MYYVMRECNGALRPYLTFRMLDLAVEYAKADALAVAVYAGTVEIWTRAVVNVELVTIGEPVQPTKRAIRPWRRRLPNGWPNKRAM